MIRSLLCAAVCTALLAGCATSPLQIPQEVKVPVPVPCIAAQDKPQRPKLRSDAELLAMDHYKRTWAMWGDRLERQAYEGELEAAVEGCSRIPALKLRAN